MEVKYYGHSCFFFKDEEKSIVFDPFGDIGFVQDKIVADYCICSHFHFDHFATDYVKSNFLVTCDNFKNFDFISGIESFHDKSEGRERGKNWIFKVKIGGFSVCHMGDIGEDISKDLINKIGKPDILLIPIGGKYTIDFKEAFDYIKEINPKIVIPMHYKTRRSDIDVDGKNEFLKLFKKENIIDKNRFFAIEKLSEKLIVFNIDDKDF